ncbi:MAG: copper amine oxidase N-terminal domain-containing protein [Filifactor alocis]|nr:copper amine oxidase N-terminal domain-containing protein [Filifactor alocis]
MKKSIALALAISLCLTTLNFIPAYAQKNEISLVIGKTAYTDYAPVLKNGRTLIPLSFLSKKLGKKVNWDSKNKKVTVVTDKVKIVLFIGKKEALINGKKKLLDTAPEIINGSTYVPISFFAESFNIPIRWDEKARAVLIGETAGTQDFSKEQPSKKQPIQVPGAYIKGHLGSNVIMYPNKGKAEDVIVSDFFKDGKPTSFQIITGSSPDEKVFPEIHWNSVNAELGSFGDEARDFYNNYSLAKGASLQLALADLDKDGIDEVIVAVHDGVIDGVFCVLKLQNYLDLGEGERVMTIHQIDLGKGWFQGEIYVDENGHLICPFGSQGLYEEYALKKGRLELIYSP